MTLNKASSNGEGFALVVALSLMSFVMLLLLTMGTLMQLESIGTSQDKLRLEAEQNALLGAYVALGDLQKLMGPDQRASATAEVLSASGISAVDASADKKRWLGVWKSDQFGYQNSTGGDAWTYNSPTTDNVASWFGGWLVSHDPNSTPSFGSVSSDFAGDLVEVVGEGSVLPEDAADSSAVKVSVPRVKITASDGSESGGYAFWVSDESMKANLQASGPERTDAANDFESIYRQSTGSRIGLESLQLKDASATAAFVGDLLKSGVDLTEPDTSGTSLFERAVPMNSPDSLFGALLNMSGDDLSASSRSAFHDLTSHSFSVLADSYRGGLKKDLSLAFEMDQADFDADVRFAADDDPSDLTWLDGEAINPSTRLGGANRSPYDVNYVFTHFDSSATDQIVRGPAWSVLRDHYRMYRPDYTRPLSGTTPIQRSGSGKPATIRATGFEPSRLWSTSFSNDSSYVPSMAESVRENWSVHNDFLIMEDARGQGNANNGSILRPVAGRLAPVVIRNWQSLGVSFEEIPSATPGVPSQYGVRFHIDLVITLWNPYNVNLEVETMRIQNRALGGDSTGTDIGNIDITKVKASGGSITEEIRISDLIRASLGLGLSQYAYINLELNSDGTDSGGRFTMEPGQVMVFSADPNQSGLIDGGGDLKEKSGLYMGPGNIGSIQLPGSGIQVAPLDYSSQFVDQSFWTFEEGDRIQIQVDEPSNDNHLIRVAVENNNGYLDMTQEIMGATTRVRDPLAFSFSDVLLPVERVWPNDGSPGWPVNNPVSLESESETPKILVNVIDIYLKSSEDAIYGVSLGAQNNPRAVVSGGASGDFGFPNRQIGFESILSTPETTEYSNYIPESVNEDGFWGPTIEASGSVAGSPTRPVFFEIPSTQALSVADLSHADISVFSNMPAYPIGNSEASPLIPSDSVRVALDTIPLSNTPSVSNGDKKTQIDWSFLLNDALWDGYFFSSITPDFSTGSTGRGVKQVLNQNWREGVDSLPNRRMQYVSSDTTSWTDLESEYFKTGSAKDGSELKADAYEKIASSLFLQGGFNVNSTSVDAWRAFLSSSLNVKKAVSTNGTSLSFDTPSNDIPYSRLAVSSAGDSSSAERNYWSGYRSYSRDQIDALAQAIVAQVKLRGPFYSLSDFVNRRLDSGASGRGGVISEAIRSLNSGGNSLNTYFEGSEVGHSLDNITAYFPNSSRDNLADLTGEGVTGHFSQLDVLRQLSPFMVTRGDTFRIRSYGDIVNPLSGDTVRAWCEIVVQRLPEYVADGTNPWDDPSALTDGRKFEVVSFRWLNEDEV